MEAQNNDSQHLVLEALLDSPVIDFCVAGAFTETGASEWFTVYNGCKNWRIHCTSPEWGRVVACGGFAWLQNPSGVNERIIPSDVKAIHLEGDQSLLAIATTDGLVRTARYSNSYFHELSASMPSWSSSTLLPSHIEEVVLRSNDGEPKDIDRLMNANMTLLINERDEASVTDFMWANKDKSKAMCPVGQWMESNTSSLIGHPSPYILDHVQEQLVTGNSCGPKSKETALTFNKAMSQQRDDCTLIPMESSPGNHLHGDEIRLIVISPSGGLLQVLGYQMTSDATKTRQSPSLGYHFYSEVDFMVIPSYLSPTPLAFPSLVGSSNHSVLSFDIALRARDEPSLFLLIGSKETNGTSTVSLIRAKVRRDRIVFQPSISVPGDTFKVVVVPSCVNTIRVALVATGCIALLDEDEHQCQVRSVLPIHQSYKDELSVELTSQDAFDVADGVDIPLLEHELLAMDANIRPVASTIDDMLFTNFGTVRHVKKSARRETKRAKCIRDISEAGWVVDRDPKKCLVVHEGNTALPLSLLFNPLDVSLKIVPLCDALFVFRAHDHSISALGHAMLGRNFTTGCFKFPLPNRLGQWPSPSLLSSPPVPILSTECLLYGDQQRDNLVLTVTRLPIGGDHGMARMEYEGGEWVMTNSVSYGPKLSSLRTVDAPLPYHDYEDMAEGDVRNEDHNLIVAIASNYDYEELTLNSKLPHPCVKEDAINLIITSGKSDRCPVTPVGYLDSVLLPWQEGAHENNTYEEVLDEEGRLVGLICDDGTSYKLQGFQMIEVDELAPSAVQDDGTPSITVVNNKEDIRISTGDFGELTIHRVLTGETFCYLASAGGGLRYGLDEALDNQLDIIINISWEYWRLIGAGVIVDPAEARQEAPTAPTIPLIYGIALIQLTISGQMRTIRVSGTFTVGRQEWVLGMLTAEGSSLSFNNTIYPDDNSLNYWLFKFLVEPENEENKAVLDIRFRPPIFRVPLTTTNSLSNMHSFGPNRMPLNSLYHTMKGLACSPTLLQGPIHSKWCELLNMRAKMPIHFELAMLTPRVSSMEYRISDPNQPATPMGMLVALGVESLPHIGNRAAHSVAKKMEMEILSEEEHLIESVMLADELEKYDQCMPWASIARLLAMSDSTPEEIEDILSIDHPHSVLFDTFGGVRGEVNFTEWLPQNLKRSFRGDGTGNQWGMALSMQDALLSIPHHEVQYHVLDLWNLGPLKQAATLQRHQREPNHVFASQRVSTFQLLPFEEIHAISAIPTREDASQYFIEKGGQSLGMAPYHPEPFVVGTGRDRGPLLSSRGTLYIMSILPHWSLFDLGMVVDVLGDQDDDLMEDAILNKKGSELTKVFYQPSPVTHFKVLGASRPQLSLHQSMAGPTWCYLDDELDDQSEQLGHDQAPLLLFSSGDKVNILALKNSKNHSAGVNHASLGLDFQFFVHAGVCTGAIASLGREYLGACDLFTGITSFYKCLYDFKDALTIKPIGATHRELSPDYPSDAAFILTEDDHNRYMRLVIVDGTRVWSYTYPSGDRGGGVTAPKLSGLSHVEVLHLREFLQLPDNIVQLRPWCRFYQHGSLDGAQMKQSLKSTQQLALMDNGAVSALRLICQQDS